MSTCFPQASLRARSVYCALVAIALVSGAAARASELRGTKEFADVAASVDAAIAKYGAEHVLLALDIDNTVMAMDNDAGSDHWFEWQKYLQDNEPSSPHLVSKTFDGLLKAQGILYDQGHMHAVDPQEPAMIAKLQKAGIATILLTSRGPEFRAVTERELKRCGYDFAPTALAVRELPAGDFLPYDPANPEKDGLTAKEVQVYKLPAPRPVSYAGGLFMTAGQHKGIMLLTLLKDSPRDIKAVIYVDDNVKHVGNVFSAAQARGIDTSSFQYQHEDTRVAKFNYSDKSDVDARWKEVERAMGGTANEPTKVVAKKPAPRKTTIRRCVRLRCCRRR